MAPLLVSSRPELLAAALTREATVPPGPALSFPGTASTSGHRVQATRWVSTELPNLGDPTGPPAGRLVGGTGGPANAEVAARDLRHLLHHHDPEVAGSGSRVAASCPLRVLTASLDTTLVTTDRRMESRVRDRRSGRAKRGPRPPRRALGTLLCDHTFTVTWHDQTLAERAIARQIRRSLAAQ